MHVAIVTHDVVRGDGQGRVNYEIAREALARGHQISLVASGVEADLRDHPRVRWAEVPVAGWPTRLLRDLVFARGTSRWLRRHRHEADLVLMNGFVSWEPSDVNVVHFVHRAWQSSPYHTARVRRGPYAWYQWLYTWLNVGFERRSFLRARLVVAVSEQVRGHLVEVGVDDAAVRVVANGVDTEEFVPGVVDRRPLALPPGVPLVLFAGDIRSARKNLDTVLQGLLRVPGVHLAVAGATDGSPYPAMTARLGLADRVHFLGYRREMAALMRACDVFVLPSRYDPFAIVVLEAMASGMPVVTVRTVGAADLVTPDCGVVLDDPDDVDGLVEALQGMVGDADGRLRMGRAARAVAERNSFSHMARQYVDLFEHLHAAHAS